MEKGQIQKNILKYIPEHKIAPYLTCGQQAEEGETGFPTPVKKDRSRFITRDQSFSWTSPDIMSLSRKR